MITARPGLTSKTTYKTRKKKIQKLIKKRLIENLTGANKKSEFVNMVRHPIIPSSHILNPLSYSLNDARCKNAT